MQMLSPSRVCFFFCIAIAPLWPQAAKASFHFGLFGGVERADLDAELLAGTSSESIEGEVEGGFGGLVAGYEIRLSRGLFLGSAILYSLCPCEQVWSLETADSEFEVENRGLGLELGLSWNPSFIKSRLFFLDLGVRYAGTQWGTEKQLNPPSLAEVGLSDPKAFSADVRSFEPYVGVAYKYALPGTRNVEASSLTWLSNVRFFLRYHLQVWSKTKVEVKQWGGSVLAAELRRTGKQQFLGGIAIEIEP